MMKDLYSAHTDEKDMEEYYEKVKDAYSKIFTRLGFNFVITEAGGGVFTEKHTHEFQVLCKTGEDTVYYCDNCRFSLNKEIFEGKEGDKCSKCNKGKMVESSAIEVGNIFPLGTWYAERMHVYFMDKDGGKKPVWFASYGIGPTRVLGTLVEVSHDDKGIIWPSQVAPFDVHLIELQGAKKVKEIYTKLEETGIDVLWDDREVGAGQKFSESDLIGIPVRLVISEKTGDKIEYKKRDSDKIELLTLEELLKKNEK
jgi:prolyl-tRNA synthetase